MICSVCGTKNPENANFCMKCANKLEKSNSKLVCTHCGTKNPDKANFCLECGMNLKSNLNHSKEENSVLSELKQTKESYIRPKFDKYFAKYSINDLREFYRNLPKEIKKSGIVFRYEKKSYPPESNEVVVKAGLTGDKLYYDAVKKYGELIYPDIKDMMGNIPKNEFTKIFLDFVKDSEKNTLDDLIKISKKYENKKRNQIKEVPKKKKSLLVEYHYVTHIDENNRKTHYSKENIENISFNSLGQISFDYNDKSVNIQLRNRDQLDEIKADFKKFGYFKKPQLTKKEKAKKIENKISKTPISKDSWLRKCPVCKSGKLSSNQKKEAFGLIIKKTKECDNCGAVFTEKNHNYKLSKVKKTDNLIWRKYKNQTLSEMEWSNIANDGVSNAERKKNEKIERERQVKAEEYARKRDINEVLSKVSSGRMNLTCSNYCPAILKKGEKPSLVLGGISFSEPRTVRQTVGVYGGPRFRVAKGVSFGLGGMGARSISHEELKKIDQGTLILTNRRLMFVGTKRTVNIDLLKIVGITPYKDGISSQRSNKQKIEYFTGTDKSNISFSINGRYHTIPVNGIVLKASIEGAINQIKDID